MKLVLFDCDGTLIDSADIIHGCMARTFREAGLNVPELQHTRSIIGLSLDLAIGRLLDRDVDDEIIHLAEQYKANFRLMRLEPGFHEPVFDGIVDLLDTLSRHDEILIGMVTGKSRRGVRAIFDAHGFGPHFLAVRTADDCPSKPHPAMVLECCSELGVDPAATIVVGDAIYDMQMAKSAGARAVGVSWGCETIERLRSVGADDILEHPNDLLRLL
ncbi:MAG: HAD-IA family hydrolase [Phyllobacterium sp.]